MLSRFVLLVLAASSAHADWPDNFIMADYQPKDDTAKKNEGTKKCEDSQPDPSQQDKDGNPLARYEEINDPLECIIAAYAYFSPKATCDSCKGLEQQGCKLPDLPSATAPCATCKSEPVTPWEKIIQVVDVPDYPGCSYVTNTALVEINGRQMFGCSLKWNRYFAKQCEDCHHHQHNATREDYEYKQDKHAVRFCKKKGLDLPNNNLDLGVENAMDKMQHEMAAIHKLLNEMEHKRSVNGSFTGPEEASFQRLEKAVEAAQSSLGEVTALTKERHGSSAPGNAVLV